MKILFATDGSGFSKKAGDAIVEYFGETVIDIKVLSVYEAFAPMAAEPFAVSAEFYQDLETAAKNQAAGFTHQTAGEISKRMPNAKVTEETAMGTPNRVIVDKAEEWGADLIIVGSHGRGFWGRVMLGSVSDAVLHHAPCSVLVVR